jgi:hypothetical protein
MSIRDRSQASGGSDLQPGPLEVPRRSFIADFLAIAALGFLVFGLGFSKLASWSSPFGESYSDILWSTGIWSGLMFGIPFGLVMAFFAQPRASMLDIESPAAFRADLDRALPRAKLAILQEASNDILIHPIRKPALPILKELTALIRVSGNQVTIIGSRLLVPRLKKKLKVR